MSPVATLHPDLRSGWRQALLAVPGLPASWAWEGRPFTSVRGQAWVRESFRPITSRVRALGTGGTVAHTINGIATLFYPAGRGTNGVEDAAGALLAAFQPGTSITYNGARAVVTGTERGPVLTEPDWVSVQVTATIAAYSVK